MVKMGLTTGGQTMIDYAKRFGFGKATGIELAGEGRASCLMPTI